MRIAVLTNVIPSATVLGGAGRIAFVYNELLTKRGHEVRVFGPGPMFEGLDRVGPFTRLIFHLQDLAASEEKAQEIVDWKPDVLLTHNLTGCGFKTPRIVKEGGIRWVHLLHDVQLIEPSGQIRYRESLGLLHRPWRWLWSGLRHTAMGEPNAVISPTRWLLDFHARYGWFKEIPKKVIPNPPSLRISPPPSTEKGGGRGVVYVGRVDADKGILALLDAWKRLDAPASRLVVIGEGKLLETLKSQKMNGVEFRGPRSSDDVRRAMEESAVVVVPSLIMENQPTVILEALAAGCRVVASDVGGVKETLGDAGWIVEPGNVEKLAESISSALDPSAMKRDTTEILKRHDPEVCVQRAEDVLKSNL